MSKFPFWRDVLFLPVDKSSCCHITGLLHTVSDYPLILKYERCTKGYGFQPGFRGQAGWSALKKDVEAGSWAGDKNPFKPAGVGKLPVPETLQKMVMSWSRWQPIWVLGQGSFGAVWLAKDVRNPRTVLDMLAGRNADLPDPGSEGQYYAIKMMKKEAASPDDCAEFIEEAEAIAAVGAHAHVLSLVGVTFSSLPFLIALEFMKYGDLLEVVKGCRAKLLRITHTER